MTTTDHRVLAPRVERTRFGLGSAYTVELFTPDEVAEVGAAVRDVPAALRHECWGTAGDCTMTTLGEPLYRNRERLDYYEASARRENLPLYRHFRFAHERVAGFFEEHYGLPVVYVQTLAVPGFHVFTFERPGEYDGGGWHVDGLYSQVPYLAARQREVEGVVNFTLPIEVPDGGSGMDLEDNRPDSFQPGGGAAVTVPYVPGSLMFTEFDYWHRIAGSRCFEPGQRRVTMQGHGVRFRGRLLLFW